MVDTLRVRFELRALDEVEPWGSREGKPTLSWFGLTDGWYDVQIGEHRLFEPIGGDGRGVDYQVVRIWEDLIQVVPYALEPVPPALAERADRGDAWEAWVHRALLADDLALELIELATAWWGHRQVDSGHLVGAPWFHVWRRDDALHARWRSDGRKPDDPTWASPRGDAILRADELFAEMLRFDRALIAAMQVRVDAITPAWRPEIAIDRDYLRYEQLDRATWLDRAMRIRPGGLPPWDDVVAAVIELEHLLGSSVLDGN